MRCSSWKDFTTHSLSILVYASWNYTLFSKFDPNGSSCVTSQHSFSVKLVAGDMHSFKDWLAFNVAMRLVGPFYLNVCCFMVKVAHWFKLMGMSKSFCGIFFCVCCSRKMQIRHDYLKMFRRKYRKLSSQKSIFLIFLLGIFLMILLSANKVFFF